MIEYSEEAIQHTNGSAPLTRLCALDTLFSATGFVDVKVGSHTIPVPIISVDIEVVQALAGKPPRAPMFINRQNGVNERIRDVADPTYMDTLEAYNRNQMIIWVCLGIAADICDKTGKVVWSADNSIHDLAGAKAALHEMGMVDNQLLAVFQGIRRLTDSVSEARMGE